MLPFMNEATSADFAIVASLLLALYLLRVRYAKGLNRFDGPFLASFTDLWKIWYTIKNTNNNKQNRNYADLHEKYGEVVRIGPNSLTFSDPQAIKEIYGSKGTNTKAEMYNALAPNVKGVVLRQLLTTTDATWHARQRRIFSSSFSLTAVIRYEPWIDNTIRVFLDQMRERFVGKRSPEAIIDLPKWLQFFAADVISELTFGTRTGFLEQGEDIEGILTGVRRIFPPWLYVSRMPLLDKLTLKNPILMWFNRRGLFIIAKSPLRDVINKQFRDRKQVWEDMKGESAADRDTLTDQFLNIQKKTWQEGDIEPQSQVSTMIIAGSETTMITLTSILYFLLKNPRCYAKLLEEIDSIPPSQLNFSKTFPYSTTQQMPYLEACIQEAMRMHTVTRIGHERITESAGLDIAGHHVPPGTTVGVSVPALHLRTEVFGKDVETYRPERWLDEDEKVSKMRNSMFTFAAGKYNCLGKNITRMEMYKFIPSLLKTYKLAMVEPDKQWTLLPGAFAIPTDFPVRMEPRNV